MINDSLFLKRVYRMSGFTGLGVAWALAMSRAYPQALGFALGVAMGLASIWLLEITVKALVQPHTLVIAQAGVMLVGFLKYILIAACFFFLVHVSWFSLGSLAAGLVLPQGVIFLKALGGFVANSPARTERAAADPSRP